MPIVVVADNEKDVAQLLRSVFRLAGFEAHSANNVQQCIDTLKNIGVDKVDVIVMDGHMASDRTSMAILGIKRMNRNIKIFVIAERYLDETKTRVLDYGANEFALKPISLNTVVEKVNMLLLEKQ